MKNKKIVGMILVVLLVVTSLVGLTGCSNTESQKVLKIGVIGPESGGAAQLGQGQRKAIQLAVDEINAQKLAGDWKVEAYFEDDEGNPTKSASATNKLIQQSQVNVIIGAIHSSATLADMVITQRSGIPQLTAGSTGASITEQGNKWIFRTAVNDEFQANALLKYAKDVTKVTKIATLTAADDYGQSGEKLLLIAAQKEGLELTNKSTYNNGDKDFKPQLLSIKDSGAQAIFMWGLYNDAALIAKQAKQLGLNVQLFGASGMAAQKLIELGGDAVQGLILTQTFLPGSPDPKVSEFVNKYKNQYQEDPIPHAAQAYDTVYILADAVKKANSNKPDALRDAIAKTTGLKLVTGNPQFDDKGNDIGKHLLITAIKGNMYELIQTVSTN
ncbi:ABC transporter substrate-binding protein [Sporomusa sp. KB1]|jgi:branched-chain amino acid transport system substrate-binding protein|uniref:ABC transporter substrate-binding protein n=1 Tax=Sporomusa sp. KB1 TaxID=943346 RepID=UPI0011A495BC|nr:ABC transporter substrate-binding protein [Sporomusa sp. KB1]TWH45735.1 branched-chain amino acid transport system substrate-binding protein [Sporomusa sp. KB1]